MAYDERGGVPRAAWREVEPHPVLDVYPGPGGGPLGVVGGGGGGLQMAIPEEARMARGGPVVINGAGLGGERSGGKLDLPPDASSTLFVDGLTEDCGKREASHIFRPFIGYREVRIVHKEAKRAVGEKVVLCFVEFLDARCAAIAMEALQGYRFDESERESPTLRVSFARNPAPRVGGPPSRDDFPRGGGGGFRDSRGEEEFPRRRR